MKHLLFLLFSIIPLCAVRGGKSLKRAIDERCRINIQTKISGGYELWPLVLDPLNLKFKEVNNDGTILLGYDEEIRIACPGYDNTITELGSSDVKVKCEDGEIFKHGGKLFSFYSLGCSRVNYLNLNYIGLNYFHFRHL